MSDNENKKDDDKKKDEYDPYGFFKLSIDENDKKEGGSKDD